MDLCRPWICALIAALALVTAGAAPSFARDHDDARRAVEAGEIRPLVEILNAARGRLPGDIVGVKLERESGRWMYELRVVDGKGRLFEIHVNAGNGDVERTEEK
ncbi:PepSY domain-containing protein [Bradyrhizobium sp. STM 3557]|uniref:PepSY domain-containing protein n=1 Tax=Bradyrhizobium sp. STM 3557 TaxID=578920 RepID=UPI00388E7829